MSDHVSLIVVLTMTSIYGWLRAYTRYERDWCGICLLPRVGIQLMPSFIVICLIYIDFVHILHWQILRDYFVLISFAAALAAEHTAKMILHDDESMKGSAVRIATLIARKKIELIDTLEKSPRCKEILVNAITTSDLLTRQQRRPLVNSLSTPPTREQILKVITGVGVAQIRVML